MQNLNFLLAVSLVLLILSSCSPDAEEAEQQSENGQNQLKTITIEVISELPISTAPPGQTGENYLTLSSGEGGSSALTSTVPNQIGENTVTQSFTAAPSSNIAISLARVNWSANTSTGQWFCYCGDVTINFYSNNELFHSVIKEMGGELINSEMGSTCPCPDGYYFSTNVIVPM